MEVDPVIALESFTELIMGTESVLFGGIKDSKVIGILGMIIFKSPVSSDIIANEHFWYIVPDYRRGLLGMNMLKKAIEWAKLKGCTQFMANASMMASNLHDDVCRLYACINMKKFETTYIKTI